MKVRHIGLTGGIGSGKSTIAHILSLLGYPVYIADAEASRLMNNHPEIRKDLVAHFGEIAYEQGRLNKEAIARIVFKDPQALAVLNAIVHPRVMEHFENWSKQQNCSLLFFESAILFEAGLNRYFDTVVCVTAPEEVRIQRVMKRDHSKAEQILQRIRNQMEDAEKCEQADFVIYNDENHPLIEQILHLAEELEQKKQ